jgi:hypothetical protein
VLNRNVAISDDDNHSNDGATFRRGTGAVLAPSLRRARRKNVTFLQQDRVTRSAVDDVTTSA